MNTRITCVACAALLLPAAGAAGAVELIAPEGGEFTAAAGEPKAMVSAPGPSGSLLARQSLQPGWYRVAGEYRTEKLPATDVFALDAKSLDWKRSLSSYERMPAASKWSRLAQYVHLEKPEVVRLRFGSAAKDAPGARVFVRGLQIAPLSLSPGAELLGNGRFAAGSVGEMPALWTWKYHIGQADDYRLVADRTFRTGSQVMRVRGDGSNWRTIISKMMPLPDRGKITLRFWARADEPGSVITARLIGSKWKWHRPTELIVGGGWKAYEHSADCPTDGEAKLFRIRLDSASGKAATVYYAGASVTWAGPPGKAAATAGAEPDWLAPPGRNLLHNGDFELRAAGWTLDFFAPKSVANYLEIAACRPCRVRQGAGVDGGAAMLLPPGPSLNAFCVPLVPGQTYTLSFDVKAVGKPAELWCACIDPGWQMYAKTFRDIRPDAWRRCAMTFTWTRPTKQRRMYARFNSGKAPLLLDRVQIAEGKAAEFDAPPVDVALRPAPGKGWVLGHGAAKAGMVVRIVPRRAAPERFAVEVVARDAWRRVAWRRTLDARAGKPTNVPVAVATDRLGVFHVSLTATSADGTLLGAGRARYAVVAEPAPAGKGPIGLFGVCYESAKFPPWHVERSAAHLAALSVRWNRFFLNPKHESPEPPAEYTQAIARGCRIQRARGVEPVPCVGLFPAKLSERIVNAEGVDREAIAEYARRLRAFVAPLKDDIRCWEILNEPNLWRHRSGPKQGTRTMPPAKYAAVLRAAAEALRSLDANLVIVAPTLNGTDFEWVEDLMKRGAAGWMDVFSIHPYRSTPEMPDVYPQLVGLRELLGRRGFRGPVINSEQYFAANLFELRGSDEETRRGYYVPGRDELRAAGRTVRNYLHHAAAGVPYASYAVTTTTFRPGPDDEVLLLDLYAAYSAAARLLAGAGRGRCVLQAGALRAFLFPDAPGGPLVAIYAIDPDVLGRMRLAGPFEAFDIMGNPLGQAERDKGLRLATDPVYIRFAKGTAAKAIAARLAAADVVGLGSALAVTASVSGPATIAATVTNRYHSPLTGRVHLEALPAGWKCSEADKPFAKLAPGASATVAFAVGGARMASLGRYAVTLRAESGEHFARREQVLSPVFVRGIGKVAADADLAEWADAAWITLDANSLSRDFDPKLPRAGDADLSARVACGWNERCFAVAVEVTDDKHHPPAAAPEGWRNDSVQLYFDPLNDANPLFAASRNYDDDITCIVADVAGRCLTYVDKGAEGRYLGQANRSTGIDTDIQCAVKRRGGKTVYEIRLPARALPRVPLRAGGSFGFSLLVNDNDGAGRKVGVTLAPKGTEPYNRPHEYRDVILRP